MKANRKFVNPKSLRSDMNAGMLGFVFLMFILILVGASLITTVADQTHTATTNANISGTATETLVDLWPLLFAIIPIIVLVRVIK